MTSRAAATTVTGTAEMTMEGHAGGWRKSSSTAAMQIRRRIEAARGYLALGMYEHALSELSEVRRDSRHRFEQFQLCGDSFCGLERWDEAIVAYMQALAERPDALPLLLALAGCYRRLGRLDRAVAAMEEAERMRPGEPAVLYAMSRLYILAGNEVEGLQWLERAVRCCPDVAAFADGDADFATVRERPRFQELLEAAAALSAY